MSEHKIRFSEKISYGFGDFASCLYFQTFMSYLMIFYTDVFGITALAAGAMIGLSRAFDAFFDPIVGMIADRTSTRWGKYRPYLLWFCVPIAIAGVLAFTTPGDGVSAKLLGVFGEPVRAGCGWMSSSFAWLAGATEWMRSIYLGFVPSILASLGEMSHTLQAEVSGQLIWAILTYNLLMFLYTAINIPYSAMLGVISPDSNERTSISSIKFVLAFTAGIIINFGLLFLVKGLGGGETVENMQHGWQLAFGVVGVAAAVFFLIPFFNTRERVSPPKEQKTSVRSDLKDLFTNGPWIILTLATLFWVLSQAVRSSVTAHYIKYFVGTQQVWLPFFGERTWSFTELASVYNGTGQIAGLSGVIAVPFYARWVGRKAAFISLYGASLAATGSFFFFDQSQIWLIYGVNLLGSVAGAPLCVLLWAMYADAADYSEWKSGRRATGLVFSASSFSQKEGWAIGAAVSMGLMSWFGFKANVDQTPETLHGLKSLMSSIPVGFGVIAIALLAVYPLGEKKVAQISADLKARRLAAGESDGSTSST